MGLSFVASQHCDSLLVVREHTPLHYRSEQSIAKYYEFTPPVTLSGIDFEYLNAYAAKPTDNYLLYHKTPTGWASVPAETNVYSKRVVSQRITNTTNNSLIINLLTIFPFPELNFTKLVTPNSDGINDYFEVMGIEKYPNAKLVILLPNGKIIREQSPYNNDFFGDGLSNGTYYFMFFGDKTDSRPVKKGFFELVR
jgi:gliding motility-associated-like protein